ncbi:hypothetical protein S83_027158 [Arachis hypogaea]
MSYKVVFLAFRLTLVTLLLIPSYFLFKFSCSSLSGFILAVLCFFLYTLLSFGLVLLCSNSYKDLVVVSCSFCTHWFLDYESTVVLVLVMALILNSMQFPDCLSVLLSFPIDGSKHFTQCSNCFAL